MYTAAVLTPESTKLLKDVILEKLDLDNQNYIFKTSGYELPHHMTINLGSFNFELNDPSVLGLPIKLFIDSIWHSSTIGVCAARVFLAKCNDKHIESTNDTKHITICIKDFAKPAYSNKLFIEESSFIDSIFVCRLEQYLELDAIIQECS